MRAFALVAAATTFCVGGLTNYTSNAGARLARVPPLINSELAELLSNNTAAQTIEDLPVAAFQKSLGADEIMYKRFSDRALSFELYIAHWRRGNPFVREAPRHPPETCWIGGGWVCDAADSNVRFKSGSTPLALTEWRRFYTAGGRRQYALYWCTVDGKPLRRVNRAAMFRRGLCRLLFDSHFVRYWCSALNPDGLFAVIPVPSPYDVYFVRLNSAQPIETILGSPLFQHLHPVFARLGLLARPGPREPEQGARSREQGPETALPAPASPR